MRKYPSDVAFTPAVKTVQERFGSRKAYARLERKGGWKTEITPELAAFLAERDSFYLASASADGQPYIQHRGGPKGFLKAIDLHTVAFADFVGNKQYITVGNLSENDRAMIFLMDYVNVTRIKLWGRARIVEQDETLMARLFDPDGEAKTERAILFHIEAWDVNCKKHITRRYAEAEIAAASAQLHARIAELESEVRSLKERSAQTNAAGA